MVSGFWRVLCSGFLLMSSPFVVASHAQQPAAPTKVVQIMGLTGVKNKTSGSLVVEGGNLRFAHAQTKVDVAVTSVQDVITGNDSQRLIHGTLGTLTMFAPYESGRFLSLFRTKLDTLTIQYRDSDGGLHGAVFTMPLGQAEVIKKKLVAQGAHTSVPSQEGADNSAPKATSAKEQKP
jgi:hypothetical protein